MIKSIVLWSIKNRFMVLVFTLFVFLAGIMTVKNTAIDAIPDLSDIQVIVKTSFAGQTPQVVEDLVTYPLTTAMLSVPKAVTVRGYSFFGDSYVYIIFEEGTDLYWARSRVLEYLSQISEKLPPEARPKLGPDATGVGWVFGYALVDRTGKTDIGQMRSLQDWFLKYELQTVPGVSEVATIGGMVKQYQIIVDPEKLRAYNIPISHIKLAIQRGNRESGASVIEMGEAEYMVSTSGYLSKIEDIKKIPLGIIKNGTPIQIKDVADVIIGSQMRRGIAELDGEGEVVGAYVVMRSGENAKRTIELIKAKLKSLQKGLPKGVEIITTYDRSTLIDNAVKNLYEKLIEEFIVVVLICAIFLFHFRSAMVIIISLPIGILGAFIIMKAQGLNANIMSLGGIAIAIGAMVDGAIVMVENVHKHLERNKVTDKNRWEIIGKASVEVGAPLFFSLLIITLSFLPVFTLEAQEGKLFAPLAFTKTYSMGLSAILAITLVPVLMGIFIRGKITPEHKNPINRAVTWGYKPFINKVLQFPRLTILSAGIVLVVGIYPVTHIGSEFMPDLDEGDLMYMPTTYPGISIGVAREIVQQTDRLLKTVPEVKTVFGKIGRAESATDPAPLTMMETLIQLKPKSEWREGMTSKKLREEFDALTKFPGITNAWVMPIKTRIDMLATGIKTPVGIKIAGPKLSEIEKIGKRLEVVLKDIPGTASVYSERVTGGRYLKADIDRDKAARYGLNIQDIQEVVNTAIGGMQVSESVEGLERYPINIRYPQSYRDSLEQIRLLPIVTKNNQRIALADVANIYIDDGPPAIKSENARLNGWSLVDIDGRDVGSYVQEAQQVVNEQVELPPGYSISWSGQYEYMVRAKERLAIVVPITLFIIMFLLYLNFKNLVEVLIIMGTLPFALVGGIWLIYLLGFQMSVAVGVGFIALAGVTVEIGVLMLVYLNQSYRALLKTQQPLTRANIKQAVLEGAGQRVRPIIMTVAAIVVGLIPIMLSHGTGSEVMQRIAAPMIGGMLSSVILTLLVIPSIFYLWKALKVKN